MKERISKPPNTKPKKSGWLRRICILILVSISIVVLLAAVAFFYNNVSLSPNEDFEKSLDSALKKSLVWFEKEKDNIYRNKNVALLTMLDDCNKMRPNASILKMIDSFMQRSARPSCWKALIDPNLPINKDELNATNKKETIDNKWILYAIAPKKARITPEEMDLYNPDRWQNRQLTHQLWALIHLKKRTPKSYKLDNLIEHLSKRIVSELYFDVAVVDIYIQKVAFVL